MCDCKHDKIRKYVLAELEWDGEECCVGHLDSPEQCWSCPECNQYVSYEDRKLMKTQNELYEKLAAIEHERGADWQKYLHSKGVKQPDEGGEWVCFPAELIRHWERQIATPYAELSEKEKIEDRKQVDRYWHLVKVK